MTKFYWLIAVILLISLALLALFFWRVSDKINLTELAPADALIYLETNDLPKLLNALTQTEAWRKNTENFGLQKDFGFSGLTARAANFGFGSAEMITLSRARIAVVLLGFEATEREQNLSLKPKAVIIAETHSSKATVQTAIENLLGKFTEKNFREPKITKTEAEGASWTIWTEGTTNRRLFAAILESTAFIGNDEQAVKNCLAVKKGVKQSLEANADLREMREKLNEKDALSFGFVTAEGVKQLSEILTAAYAGTITESESAMSLIAQSFPPFVQKSVNSIGWTAKFANGKIVDRYFLAMPDDLSANLQTPTAPSIESTGEILNLLPQDVNSLTHYNLQNPAKAWSGFIFAASTKLDALSAAFLTKVSGALLAPYGIAEPNVFLNAVGTEIVTAKLAAADENSLTIFTVRDVEALKNQLFKKLGSNAPKIEASGNTQIFIAPEEDFAGAFFDKFLIVGTPENVRKVLETNAKATNFHEIFRQTANSAIFLKIADETESVGDFLRLVGTPKDVNQTVKKDFAVSETRLFEKGFERRTTSNFGLFGTLATRFGKN